MVGLFPKLKWQLLLGIAPGEAAVRNAQKAGAPWPCTNSPEHSWLHGLSVCGPLMGQKLPVQAHTKCFKNNTKDNPRADKESAGAEDLSKSLSHCRALGNVTFVSVSQL